MLFNYTDAKTLLYKLNNVISTPDGFDFICYLLDELKAFEYGNNFENVYMNYANNAIRTKGLQLLELIMISNFDKFTEIHKKRNEELCKRD